MNAIGVGFIFRAAKRHGSILPGLHRVIEVSGDPNSDECPLVIIQIPEQPPPRQTGKKQASYYAPGFKATSVEALRELLAKNKIVEASAPPIPPWWAKSDAQLLDECPRERWVKQGDTWVTPAVGKRERKWAWIEPLVLIAESRQVSSIAHLDSLVPARAKELGIGSNQMYDALHRYYAFGQTKDALLPNTPKSGGIGQERFAKNGVRLGAPNAAAKVGNTELGGKICDEHDRQNMRDGFQMFVRPGVSQNEAFLAFASTYYSDGYKYENGYQLPLLLQAHQRPTQREFFDHGPEKQDRESMLRRVFGEGEWAKDRRPLAGTVQDGNPAIGLTGSLDASPIDVNLVSCFNPYFPIGVPRGLFVREAALGLWCGAHNVIGGPGTADALLTILQAALGQEDKLRRLRLDDIPPEDFPTFIFNKIYSDNGELRAIAGMENCAQKIRTSIEFIESGRADRNSPSEGGHHSRHAGLDHKLPGTTLGRPVRRGEPLPITKALLSLYAYERLLWQWMHWSNTKQLVPHLVPTEMMRDMAEADKQYLPTRIEIYRWANSKGYVVRRPMDALYLKSNLLPTYTATVTRSGLILHRPETGGRVELLKGAIFNSAYIEQSCLYHSFGDRRKPHVTVRVDPDDLSKIIYVDDHGPHEVPNTTNDQIVVWEYYLQDLIARNDADRLGKIERQSEVDQAASDLRLARAAEADEARAKRQAASTNVTQNKQKLSRDGVRANQQREREAQLDQAAKRAAGATNPNAGKRPATVPTHTTSPQSNVVRIDSQARLKQAMAERMKSFNDRRA